jgi:MFS family permease
VFEFGEPRTLIPLWLACLWLLLATTLNHCLAWTAQPWWRGSLLGAIGAPLSYYGGAQIAGVILPYGTWQSLLLIAAIWAVVMPVLHGFAKLYRNQHEQRLRMQQSA